MLNLRLSIIKQFESKLMESHLRFEQDAGSIYTVIKENPHHLIRIRLLTSDNNRTENLISPNGNSLLSVAKFGIRLVDLANSEYTILGFVNLKTLKTEFVVISTNEFLKKTSISEPGSINSQIVNLRFWLMEDRSLFETMNMSLEGEWYFLSKGFNGRLADKEEWCFTSYLNNWGPLLVNLFKVDS